MKKFLWEALITGILTILAFFIIQTTIQNSVVLGSSMEPGLHDGQRLIANKAVFHWLTFDFQNPKRGDIIVFDSPVEDTEYIKRVIGLPGDTVEVKNHTVYVNGVALKEPYIKDAPNYAMSKVIVPPDHYFVMGDNRNNSNDSHTGWTVPRESIVGRVWVSYWPPDEWGDVGNVSLQEQLNDSGAP